MQRDIFDDPNFVLGFMQNSERIKNEYYEKGDFREASKMRKQIIELKHLAKLVLQGEYELINTDKKILFAEKVKYRRKNLL